MQAPNKKCLLSALEKLTFVITIAICSELTNNRPSKATKPPSGRPTLRPPLHTREMVQTSSVLELANQLVAMVLPTWHGWLRVREPQVSTIEESKKQTISSLKPSDRNLRLEGLAVCLECNVSSKLWTTTTVVLWIFKSSGKLSATLECRSHQKSAANCLICSTLTKVGRFLTTSSCATSQVKWIQSVRALLVRPSKKLT